MSDQSWPPPAGGAPQPQVTGPDPWAAPQAAPVQQAAPVRQATQPGGLWLRTGYSPLAFLLHFFPPKVSIDGGPQIDLRWGDNPLPGLPPGPHRVRVWFRYLFYGECGVADAVVHVPDQGLFLEYRPPTWFVFSRGKFPSLEHQSTAMAGAPAAPTGTWHPDPTGRAEQRFWDGQRWTGHVVRGGQQGWDPV